MSQQQLKPFLVGYVSNHYEDIDDALVFAYNEAHAIQVVCLRLIKMLSLLIHQNRLTEFGD
jgi:hypothetical protein